MWITVAETSATDPDLDLGPHLPRQRQRQVPEHLAQHQARREVHLRRQI